VLYTVYGFWKHGVRRALKSWEMWVHASGTDSLEEDEGRNGTEQGTACLSPYPGYPGPCHRPQHHHCLLTFM